MSLDQQASENLQIIRSLMERSTIYRAISAPTAFVGGTSSILMGFWGENAISHLTAETLFRPYTFFIAWSIVISLTIGTHLLQLYRDSLKNGESIFSSRHLHAFQCMFPAIFIAGILTFFGLLSVTPDLGPEIQESSSRTHIICWTLFYGIALLSTQTFSPKSIQWLGWTFFTAGVLEFVLMRIPSCFETIIHFPPSYGMALTFGLFHLIYAIAVKVTEVNQAPEPGCRLID